MGDTEPYDAVVLVYQRIDGTVLEKWRKITKTSLFDTSLEISGVIKFGFDAGADDYVAKPFQMEEVLQD